MGICGEDIIKKEESTKSITSIKLNQKKLVDKVLRSICKITTEINEKNNHSIGFFLNVSESSKYLITNSNIANSNIEIETKNKNRIKLDLDNRNIKHLEHPKDTTFIEIKKSDKISEEIEFLDYDRDYIKGYNSYKGKNIFSIKNPFEKDTLCSTGKIININNNEFEFNISTDKGYFGYPILLLNDNINSIKVIGVHKNCIKSQNLNEGIFIGEILKVIINDSSKDSLTLNSNIESNRNIAIKEENNNNYIIAEIYIKDSDIDKDIRIMNSYEEFMRKNYPDEQLDKNEINEKEINQCDIIIDNKPISFNYFYNFNKSGKYTIKYLFKNDLTKINYMFGECKALISINLSNFNSQHITNISWIFGKCVSLNNIDFTNFITKNVIDMSGVFYGCKSLKNINLKNFNTENVIDMKSMFKKCESLKEIDISNFNTQNVKDMSGMFDCCRTLININLSNFDTKNVIDLSGMFDSCISLTKINISNFNTKNVSNLSCMFCQCLSLPNINISNFNTEKVTNMYCMFYACKSLNNINLSNFKTEKVTDMGGMFNSCKALKHLDLSHFDTKNVMNMSDMFFNCESLVKLNLSNFNIQNVKNIEHILDGCIHLKKENLVTKEMKIIEGLKII